MAIVGEIPSSYVLNQVSYRQQFFGSTTRDPNWHQYATSRTAWAKLASGVSLKDTPVNSGGVNTKNTNIKYPQKFVLFNGTSEQTNNTLLQRSGIGKHGSYDTWDSDFGIVPMPGMESISVKAKNRGSIREATIRIKCWSRKQFEIIDKIYLRLGYNMLLEWGWSHWLTSATEWKTHGKTLIDGRWWDVSQDSKRSVRYWLNAIEEFRQNYKGNYDGFYGKVVNFNWSIETDGSYSITLKLITHGDIVESLTFPTSFTPKAARTEQKVKDYILETLFKDKALKKCWNSKFFQISWSTSGNPDSNSIPFNADCPFRYYGEGYLKNVQGKDQLSQHLFHLQLIGRGMENGRLQYFLYTIDSNALKVIQRGNNEEILASDVKIHGKIYGLLKNQTDIYNKNYIDMVNRWNIYQPGISSFYTFGIGTNINAAGYFSQNIKDNGFGNESSEGKIPVGGYPAKEAGFSFYSVLKGTDDITSKMSPKLKPRNSKKNVAYSTRTPVDSYQDAFVIYSQESGVGVGGKDEKKRYFPMKSNTYVRLQYILWYIDKYIIPEDKDLSEKIINVGWKDQIICYLGVDTWGSAFAFSSQPHNVTFPNPQWSPKDPNGKPGLKTKGNTTMAWCTNSYGEVNYVNSDSTGNINYNLKGDPEWFLHTMETKNKKGEEVVFPYGLGKNLYFNTNFLTEILGSTNDSSKQPKIDVFSFLKKLCDTANNACGNIFNLEPIIDDSTNTLRIIDGTNHPFRKEIYELLGLKYVPPTSNELIQTYGYRRDSLGNTVTNFMRKFDIQTKIDKNLASMITIGATAQGGSTGVEATAFSRFNKGIENRFSKEYKNPSKTSSTPKDPLDQFWISTRDSNGKPSPFHYLSQFGINVSTGWNPQFVNFVEFDPGKENKFKSTQSDIYKYVENQKFKNSNSGSPSIGFLPFSFNLELDGISGYKIYNMLNVSISLLPSNYPKALEFIVSGVDHEIKDNDWVTKITTVSCPKAAGEDVPKDLDLGKGSNFKSPKGKKAEIKVEEGGEGGNPPNPSGNCADPSNPPKSKSDCKECYGDALINGFDTPLTYGGKAIDPIKTYSKVRMNSSVKNKILPILNSSEYKTKYTKGHRMFALVWAIKEGFKPGSRSFRNNNPGNIGNTDNGNNKSMPNLKAGTDLLMDFIKKASEGSTKYGNSWSFGEKTIKPYWSTEIHKNKNTYKRPNGCLPGYKGNYTGQVGYFTKVYATFSRVNNSSTSKLLTIFGINGKSGVNGDTTLKELLDFNNNTPIKFKS